MILKTKHILSMTLVLALVFFMGACGDDVIPTITGANEINVTVGTELPDLLGIIDLTGIDTEDVSIDYSGVDLNTVGTYTVSYSVNIEGAEAITYNISVNVVSHPITKEPLIFGIDDITYIIGNALPNLLDGVSASDMDYGDITFRIELDATSVDYEVVGVYDIYYYVENTDGYSNYQSAKVNVVLDEINLDIPEEFAVVVYDGLYGLVNLDNEIIIPFEYDTIEYIGSGMFRLEKFVPGEMYEMRYYMEISEDVYYFNSNNNEFYQYTYQPYDYFVDGITRVRNEYSYYAIMGMNGNYITPFIYSNVYLLEDNRVIVRIDDNYGLIDYEGNEIIELKYDNITSFFGDYYIKDLDGIYEVITLDNEVLFELSSSEFGTYKMADESFVYNVERDGYQIIVDESFNVLLETEDTRLSRLSGGLFVSNTPSLTAVPTEYTFYDTDMNIVIEDVLIYDHNDELIIFATSEGYGLFNIAANTITIDPQYDSIAVLPGSDNLYIVSDNTGKKGIVTATNVERFDFIANSIIKNDNEDFYRYTDKDGYFGLIDINGSAITHRTYISIGEYIDGFALVHDPNGFYSYIYESGLLVSPPSFIEALPFNNGYAVVKLYEYDDSWAAFGSDLTYLGMEYFYEISEFSEGIARVRLNDFDETAQYSYIDKDGLITDQVFARAYSMVNGHAIVSSTPYDDTVGSINADGEIVVPLIYYGVGEANDGMIRVSTSYYVEGFYNYAGELAIPIGYDYHSYFNDGRIIARDGNTYAIFDREGNTILDFSNFYIHDYSEGYARTQDFVTGLRGFLDLDGNVVIEPTFANINNFSGGVAVTRSEITFLYGFIDTSGEVVADYIFNSISGFSSDSMYAVVRIDNKDGIIDKFGNMVFECEYDIDVTDTGYIINNHMFYGELHIEKDRDTLRFSIFDNDGLEYLVEYNNGWVLRNNGNVVISADFEHIIYDRGNDSWILIENGYRGLYDNEYNMILDTKYDSFSYSGSNNDIYVEYLGNYGVVSETGEVIIEPIYDNVQFIYGSEFYLVSIGDIEGLYSSLGEMLLPVEYYDIRVNSEAYLLD